MVWWFQGETWGQGFLGSATSRDSDSGGAAPSLLARGTWAVKPGGRKTAGLCSWTQGEKHILEMKKKKRKRKGEKKDHPVKLRFGDFFPPKNETSVSPTSWLTRLPLGGRARPGQRLRVAWHACTHAQGSRDPELPASLSCPKGRPGSQTPGAGEGGGKRFSSNSCPFLTLSSHHKIWNRGRKKIPSQGLA